MESTESQPTETCNVELQKKPMGFPGGFSLVVGCIIGSGIFISVRETLTVAPKNPLICLLFWILGGITAILGGLCYASLGIMLPYSGGERMYLCESFGRKISLTYSYVCTFLSKPISYAAIALTFGKYFVEIIGENSFQPVKHERMIAASAIILSLVINLIGTRLASKAQIIFLLLKLSSVFTIIIASTCYIIKNKIQITENFDQIDYFDVKNVGSALMNVFWAYEGWNGLGMVAGEIVNPKRNLPISIIGGVITVMCIYVLTVASYMFVLGYDVVANTDTIAVSYAQLMFPKAKWIIPVFICISTFGALNGSMMIGSRISFTSAINKELPAIFSLIHTKTRSPVVSSVVVALMPLLYLLMNFQKLLKAVAFINWMIYILSMSSLIYLRIKRPELDNKLKIPFFIPVMVQMVGLFMVFSCFYYTPLESTVISTIIIGTFSLSFIETKFQWHKKMKIIENRIIRFLKMVFHLTEATKSDIS